MSRLRELTVESEARLQALKREEELDATRAGAPAAATLRLERQGVESRRALDQALEEFRAEARREASPRFRTRRSAPGGARAAARRRTRARASLHARRQAIAPRKGADSEAPLVVAPGAGVRIVSLDREGEIVSVRGDPDRGADGAATFAVAREDVAAAGAESQKVASKPAAAGRPRTYVDDINDGPAIELHLLGQTVDEALLLSIGSWTPRCAADGRRSASSMDMEPGG